MKAIIEEYQPGQENEICQMVKRVYDEFVATDNTEEGNKLFYDCIKPKNIAARQKEKNNILIAKDNEQIVGMVEIGDNQDVFLLYVDKAHQKQGIAKRLYLKAVCTCVKKQPDLNKFSVHASLYSVPVFEKLGFTATGPKKTENGITYLPMVTELKV